MEGSGSFSLTCEIGSIDGKRYERSIERARRWSDNKYRLDENKVPHG